VPTIKNHVNQPLSVVEIVSPERPESVLTADVPNVRIEPPVFDCLDIETNRRDRRHRLTEFQFLQNRCLPGIVESEHQTATVAVFKPMVERPEESAYHRNDVIQ
jgi:hypothetical protein